MNFNIFCYTHKNKLNLTRWCREYFKEGKIIIEQYSRDSQAQNKFTSTDKKTSSTQ